MEQRAWIDELGGRVVLESDHNPPDPLTLRRVQRLIDELPMLQARIVRWLLGIGGDHLDPEEVASRLNMSEEEMWRHLRRATQEVGWRAITELVA